MSLFFAVFSFSGIFYYFLLLVFMFRAMCTACMMSKINSYCIPPTWRFAGFRQNDVAVTSCRKG